MNSQTISDTHQSKHPRSVLFQVVGGIFVIVLLLGLISAGMIYQALQPVHALETETQQFIIPKGQALAVVAQRLEAAGLVRSAIAFRAVARIDGIEHDIQAGTFALSPGFSTREVAHALTQGTEDMWITVLEGWRAEEVADYLGTQELPLFDQTEFLSLAANTPGMLFPDTYLVPREISATQLHALFTRTFTTKVTEGLATEFAASTRSPEDILIMASLIEREARDYQQMRHVSAILWNRIDIGMPLQVDATLQYAAGYDAQAQSWWSPPTAALKEVDSSYNTYRNAGLPPGPISNPGLDAMKAALDPLDVDDLFYLHSRSGEMYYAETLEQHNANVDRYLR